MKFTSTFTIVLVTTCFFTFSSISIQAQTISLGNGTLEKIEILKPGLYPEDIKYNPITEKFLVGSFREGAVYEIDQKGNTQLLVQDDRLISALGIHIDAKRNKLYVVTANLGASIKTRSDVKKLAALGVYDLDTGLALSFVNLGGLQPELRHLANGITLDTQGNIYVTDSFSPVIYKIDQGGKASIFLESEYFAGEGINLNGIAFHPDGYLIVAKKSDGTLFRVPLRNPEKFTKIKLPKKLFGLDGVTLVNSSELVVIANRASGVDTNAAFALHSKDGWASAIITDSYKFGNVYPTTSTIKGDKIFVIHSKIGDLVSAPAEKKKSMEEKAVIQQIGKIFVQNTN